MWFSPKRSPSVFSPVRVWSDVVGWRQAGLSSFAYRLAHLTLPRPMAVAGVFLMFYLA
jgi:hypothetical protein